MNLFEEQIKEKNDNEVLTVSTYLDRLNFRLKGEKAKISGEVSGFQHYPGRSYLYFSLKDSDGSTVKCFMWKNDYKISSLELSDGLEVVVSAFPNVYKPNGGMTLQVDSVELLGQGALKIAYEKLKAKLSVEGLFDQNRKREIPRYPKKIGIITSKQGAVINDFLSNIGKFGFEIIFIDSKVEGADAVKDLLLAINRMEKEEVEVLVIVRGGGSLESFQAFNNETLVRAVSNFPHPTITGIGHDKDLPLVSMVSDKNVSTPTAVTTILNQSWNNALSTVHLAENKIFSSFEKKLQESAFMVEHSFVSIEGRFSAILEVFKRSEATIQTAMIKIGSVLSNISKSILLFDNSMTRGFVFIRGRVLEKINNFDRILSSSNPERQLSLGYSIIRSAGKIIRNKKQVQSGDKLDIMVSDGSIESEVV